MAIDENELQKALAVRIGMQIAVSSIPAVEEKMDIDLDRWIDAVPLPPEVPSDSTIHIEAAVGSDLTRMRWSTFGHPAGFIPKMADYLNRCGLLPVDVDLINRMGDAIQPMLVGHWVAIADGEVRTGWQFREPRRLIELQPHLGSDFVIAKLMAWAARRDVDQFRGFVRSIGRDPTSRIELSLPGAAAAQLELAASGFEDMSGQPLPAAVRDAVSDLEAPDVSLWVELAGAEVRAVGVGATGMADDVAAAMCTALGLHRADTLGQIAQTLRAGPVNRVEVQRRGEVQLVDLVYLPGTVEPAPPQPGRN